MSRLGHAFFAIGIFFLLGSGVVAEENPSLPESTQDEIKKIRDEVREQKLQKAVAIDGIPLCSELFRINGELNVAIIEQVLNAVGGEYKELNAQLDHFFRVPASPDKDHSYFGSETLVDHATFDGNQGDRSIKTLAQVRDEIVKVQMELQEAAEKSQGDAKKLPPIRRSYLLSSTRKVLKFPGLQLDCWDEVNSLIDKPIQAGTALAEFIYVPTDESLKKDGIAGRSVVVEPTSQFYCIEESEIVARPGGSIKFGTNLVTVKGELNSLCQAATSVPRVAKAEMNLFSVSTHLTSAYYIGEKDRQILVSK